MRAVETSPHRNADDGVWVLGRRDSCPTRESPSQATLFGHNKSTRWFAVGAPPAAVGVPGSRPVFVTPFLHTSRKVRLVGPVDRTVGISSRNHLTRPGRVVLRCPTPGLSWTQTPSEVNRSMRDLRSSSSRGAPTAARAVPPAPPLVPAPPSTSLLAHLGSAVGTTVMRALLWAGRGHGSFGQR
jgi:hypothetical protein